ncbi:MAG: hypothetical protein J7515_00210 [Caulobacter sp.]|nr:hypothetical protein [Caulobacter sp.]
MAATSSDAQASPEEVVHIGFGDPLTSAMWAAAVHSASLALVSAAQHLQRTTLLVETATAVALRDAGGRDEGQDHRLALARAAMADAVNLFETVQAQGQALASSPKGTKGT